MQAEEEELTVLPTEAEASEGELVWVNDDVTLLVGVAEAVPAEEAVGAATVRDTLRDTEGVGEPESEPQLVGERLGVTELDGLADTVDDAVVHVEGEEVPFDDDEEDGVRVPLAVATGEAEAVSDAFALAEAKEEEVPTAVAVVEELAVGVPLSAAEALAEAVPFAVAEEDGVPSPVAEELCDTVLVSVAQSVPVVDAEFEETWLGECVPEGLPL